MNQYFNNSTVAIYKDLPLFSKKLIYEIKKNPKDLPQDTFKEFFKIYKKFVFQGDLQNEYLKCCEVYQFFKNATVLPKIFHLKENKEEEKELSSSEETSSDEFDHKKETLFSQKPLQLLNLCIMKTVYKVLQDSNLATLFPSLNTALKTALTL